jgi:hypothetical protein
MRNNAAGQAVAGGGGTSHAEVEHSDPAKASTPVGDGAVHVPTAIPVRQGREGVKVRE